MTLDPNRWQHLETYEKRYLKSAMQAYDDIMLQTQDISVISQHYHLSLEEVQRAKDYAFGRGVSQNQFAPEIKMAEAWCRLISKDGTPVDEVLLRHEIYESDLVINKGYKQSDAHKLAQKQYPWSDLIK
jgi:hypothetical protein